MKGRTRANLIIIFILITAFTVPILSVAIVLAGSMPEDDVQETIKMWFLYKLKNDLDLSAEQSLAIYEKVDLIENSRRQYFKFERESLLAANRLITAGKDSSPELTKLMDDLDKKQEAMFAVQLKTTQELKKALNPAQRAKLLILMKKLQRKIRSIIDILERKNTRNPDRRGQPGGPGGLPPHPPEEEQEPF
jgi:hypothetical protein